MSINADTIRALRERAGCSILDARTALICEAGDLEAAVKSVAKMGLAHLSAKQPSATWNWDRLKEPENR